jgi:hypothetical protein
MAARGGPGSRPEREPTIAHVDRDVAAEDVVERALAILEQDSREWAERQNRLYTTAVEPDPRADHGL